jgi:hypothetical protein
VAVFFSFLKIFADFFSYVAVVSCPETSRLLRC